VGHEFAETIGPLNDRDVLRIEEFLDSQLQELFLVLNAVGVHVIDNWLGRVAMDQDIGRAGYFLGLSSEKFGKEFRPLRFTCP
jgi:hypothetical protein